MKIMVSISCLMLCCGMMPIAYAMDPNAVVAADGAKGSPVVKALIADTPAGQVAELAQDGKSVVKEGSEAAEALINALQDPTNAEKMESLVKEGGEAIEAAREAVSDAQEALKANPWVTKYLKNTATPYVIGAGSGAAALYFWRKGQAKSALYTLIGGGMATSGIWYWQKQNATSTAVVPSAATK